MLQEPAYSKFSTQLAYRLAPEWTELAPAPQTHQNSFLGPQLP